MSISPNMPCDKRYLRIPCCVPLPAAREFLHIKITRSHAEHSHTFVHSHHNAASIFIVSLYKGAKERPSLASQAVRIARIGASSGQLDASIRTGTIS
jgi:hypothetical protein